MRKVIQVCFYLFSILGMLLYSFYDLSKYSAVSSEATHFVNHDYRGIFFLIASPAFLIFIGLLVYEIWIISTSNSLKKSKELAVSKKNLILAIAMLFAVLNISVLTTLIRNLLIRESNLSSKDYWYEGTRLKQTKIIYFIDIPASLVPVILAIIIRIGKPKGRFVRVTAVVASIFSVLMGVNWYFTLLECILNDLDFEMMFGAGLSGEGSTFKVLPVNLVLVLLMLIITIIVTSMKKNQIKYKWLLAVVLILATLNVPFFSYSWSSNEEVHISVASKIYEHYSMGIRVSNADIRQNFFDSKEIEAMKIYGEDDIANVEFLP